MTIILKWFKILVPYFVTFSFQVLCIIFLKKLTQTVLRLCCCVHIASGHYPTLTSYRALHQNDPIWRKRYMHACFMLSSRGALKIILILTQKFTKRIVNMCAKFWENKLTDFGFMDFTSNWHDPGQSMDKPTRVW